jgi:hypothetical protein
MFSTSITDLLKTHGQAESNVGCMQPALVLLVVESSCCGCWLGCHSWLALDLQITESGCFRGCFRTFFKQDNVLHCSRSRLYFLRGVILRSVINLPRFE